MTSIKKESEVLSSSIPKTKRSIWTKEEDEILLKMTEGGEPIDWNKVAEVINPLRPPQSLPKNPKQCRERWHNRVNPVLKQSEWSSEEIDLFFMIFKKYGSKWSKLALKLAGRTDNTIKNFFYCKLRKIARRIKKGVISDDMKSSCREIEHNLFLINYLRSYMDGDKKCSINDKYIMKMIQSSSISIERIDDYIKEYKTYNI